METFKTKQELLDSFTMYAMESSKMDKVSAQEYAKMMISYRPEVGWVIRDYGYAPRSLCRCGHSIELHDDQAVCRALLPKPGGFGATAKSCQCMQFSTTSERTQQP